MTATAADERNSRNADIARDDSLPEAERVLPVVQMLHSSLELSDVVDRIAETAHDLIRRPIAVWLMDGDKASAVARSGGAMVGLGEERPLPKDVQDRMTASMREFESSGELPGGASAWGGTNRVIVPLVLDENLFGFVAAGPWEDAPPEKSAVRLLFRIAPHAASAVHNARRHADMLRLSLTDALVQLPNRRQLDFFLEKEFHAAQRGRPLCFVIFDLDHFKKYNDANGHRAGDLALIAFADVLRAETRSMNLAARYGGEEFASVLSSTTITGAKGYADRVRRHVEDVFDGDLTVSSGVVEYSDRFSTPSDMVVAADRALYRAKQDGRNRVYVANA